MALKFVLNTAPLFRLGEILDREMDAAAEKLARETVGRAQELVPVRTGALQRSIEAEQAGPAHWEVVAGMDYAAAVEFGVNGRAGQPYLTPAMEEARAKLPDVLTQALNGAVKEAGNG